MNLPPDTQPDFVRLFEEQRENVRAQLARLVPPAEIDDLLQETFVKAAKAWATFRGESAAATWVHQIAQRTALDHLRSRRHHEQLQTVPLAPDDDEENGKLATPAALVEPAVASTRLERQEMHGCIREYVERLAPAHREIIELKDLSGLTNAEIAERLGISLDAAKIRLHRARAALRQQLADGCEFYQSDTGTLACDRRAGDPVSLPPAISSNEVQAEDAARCDAPREPGSRPSNNMSSSCGCSAPETCTPAPSAGSLFTAQAAEFVALGAAIGSNCEPCLRYHVREALRVGLSLDDISRAVAVAAQVKETPARNILKLAETLVRASGNETTTSPTTTGGCGCSA